MKKITEIFILSVVVIALVYDVYALTSSGAEATISSRIIVLSRDYLIIPFLFGMLMGHLFWRMDSNKDVA